MAGIKVTALDKASNTETRDVKWIMKNNPPSLVREEGKGGGLPSITRWIIQTKPKQETLTRSLLPLLLLRQPAVSAIGWLPTTVFLPGIQRSIFNIISFPSIHPSTISFIDGEVPRCFLRTTSYVTSLLRRCYVVSKSHSHHMLSRNDRK